MGDGIKGAQSWDQARFKLQDQNRNGKLDNGEKAYKGLIALNSPGKNDKIQIGLDSVFGMDIAAGTCVTDYSQLMQNIDIDSNNDGKYDSKDNNPFAEYSIDELNKAIQKVNKDEVQGDAMEINASTKENEHHLDLTVNTLLKALGKKVQTTEEPDEVDEEEPVDNDNDAAGTEDGDTSVDPEPTNPPVFSTLKQGERINIASAEGSLTFTDRDGKTETAKSAQIAIGGKNKDQLVLTNEQGDIIYTDEDGKFNFSDVTGGRVLEIKNGKLYLDGIENKDDHVTLKGGEYCPTIECNRVDNVSSLSLAPRSSWSISDTNTVGFNGYLIRFNNGSGTTEVTPETGKPYKVSVDGSMLVLRDPKGQVLLRDNDGLFALQQKDGLLGSIYIKDGKLAGIDKNGKASGASDLTEIDFYFNKDGTISGKPED